MKTLEVAEYRTTGGNLIHEAEYFITTSKRSRAEDCLCDGGQDCSPDRTKPRKRITTALYNLMRLGTKRQALYENVMKYKFEPVIHRMVDKRCWPEWLAREVFEEYKKYAWLCVHTGQHLAPTKVIDEVWHNHILFTQDYAHFCNNILGTFLHHRPSRRNEKHEEAGGETPIQLTTRIATQAFGKLSKHWEFHEKQTCDGNTGCDGQC